MDTEAQTELSFRQTNQRLEMIRQFFVLLNSQRMAAEENDRKGSLTTPDRNPLSAGTPTRGAAG
jgi:hypothetical protein